MSFKNKKLKNEYFRKYNKNKRKLFRERILGLKREIGRCKECGYKDHIEILQFHHKDKEKKVFRFAGGNIAYYNWEKVLIEIKKCKLICPNCHMWKHYQERDWFTKQGGKYIKNNNLKNRRRHIHLPTKR